MVTLTEKDLMELLQKNNLREDALEKEVVERLAALHMKTAFAPMPMPSKPRCWA